MGEYLESRVDAGMTVRVHPRVLAGLEHEGTEEFGGILLGAMSPAENAVWVEDFERLAAGASYDRRAGTVAGHTRHPLPPLGYFRVASGARLRIDDEDRAALDRDFPDPLQIFLVFQRTGGHLRWADAYVQASAAPQESYETATAAAPVEEPAAPRERAGFPLWPIAAVLGGALIGSLGYLAISGSPRLRGERPAVSRKHAVWPPAGIETAPPPAPASEPVQTVPQPVSAAKPAPFEADRAAARPVDPAQMKKQVRSVLDRWRDSLLHGDVETYAGLYAPTVGPYFTKSQVSRADVAAEVRRVVAQYGPLTTMQISDVSIQPVDQDHAVATFRKKWNTGGDQFSGEEKSELGLKRAGSGWAIASERELKVYWVKRKKGTGAPSGPQ